MSQKRFAEALLHYTNCFERRKSHFGENDRHTLTTMLALAQAQDSLANVDTALQLYKDCLGKCKSFLGIDDELTLMCMHSFAGIICLLIVLKTIMLSLLPMYTCNYIILYVYVHSICMHVCNVV